MDGLSLTVPAGEICVLVGPSGCGKTTAMRMVNRMIDITSGDIRVGGRSVKDRDVDDLRREIGYVIQQIGLFPHRTIGDNIATVPKLLGWAKRRGSRSRVHELLDLIGLPPEMAKRYPAQLSGGQRQRVGVARALAADPPLMLMDEPFGAIDPINRERLQNEFLRLQAEIRKTIVFVTHDIDEAIKMGDRIAILEVGGHLAQYATPSEILLHPANEFVEDFVGADRALKRLALMRVRDIPREALGSVNGGPELGARHARCATRSPICCSTAPRTAAWSTPKARRSAASASRRWPTSPAGGRRVILLAQLEIRERGGEPSCVERNGFCPDWIADNWERYKTPLIEHIELTLITRRDRLRDRVHAGADRAPAALADPAGHADHRDPLHAAERRAVLPAAAADRPRQDDRGDRARRLHAADHLPQRDHGPGGRARPRRATPAAAWASRSASCCGGSSCRWRCRRSWPGCGSRSRRPSG